jgi:hypothetical protein
LLTVCVTAVVRTRANVGVAEVVATVIADPRAAVAGALTMPGRALAVPSGLRRYGGVKICPLGWFVAHVPQSPPPPENTRPSGSRTATL